MEIKTGSGLIYVDKYYFFKKRKKLAAAWGELFPRHKQSGKNNLTFIKLDEC